MTQLIAIMGEDGDRFEMPIGMFPDIVQAAEWVKKYSDALKASEYRIITNK